MMKGLRLMDRRIMISSATVSLFSSYESYDISHISRKIGLSADLFGFRVKKRLVSIY